MDVMTIELTRPATGPLSASVPGDLRPGFRDDLCSRQADRLNMLLQRRDDLRGVSDYVDFVSEAVRWTA